MSHVNISADVAQYAADSAYAASKAVEYVFGETNNVSGGGSPVISPTFGAAIWVLDYVTNAVSSGVGIKRLYFHQGATDETNYVWWTLNGVRAPFYGGYVAASALAGGETVITLDEGFDNYSGYAVFGRGGVGKSVVLINTDYFDGNGTRSTQEFVIKGLLGTKVMAKRLTAESALSRQDQGENQVFGGQSFSNETCRPVGEPSVEIVEIKDCSANFVIAASEALLIEL